MIIELGKVRVETKGFGDLSHENAGGICHSAAPPVANSTSCPLG